jgi:hypothetical protein
VPNQNLVNLYDRIKEISYTVGTGNLGLAGAAVGFSSFASVYSHLSPIIYAVTDGINYEIGSGVLLRADYDNGDGITYDTLSNRTPIRSSNSNSLVSFPPGTKEVYVTYPATHAVMMGSGLGNLQVPQRKGVAIWDSENILNYDSNIIWDNNLKCLGLQNTTPTYGIDIGGDGGVTSSISASGYNVGSNGVYFQPENGNDASYPGGTQFQHFEKNRLDAHALSESLIGQLTGSDAVLELSGVVNQYILLRKQNSGHVFAGPADSCGGTPCQPGYPSFRNLVLADIPDLTSIYATFTQLTGVSGALNTNSTDRISAVSGALQTQYNSGIAVINQSIASGESRFNDYVVAASGRLDDFIITTSGDIRNITPIYKIVNKTIPVISSNTTYETSFDVSGIIANQPYSVNVSPSVKLNGNVLLTYSFPSGTDTVSSVFYNAGSSSSTSQTLNFFITAHKVIV